MNILCIISFCFKVAFCSVAKEIYHVPTSNMFDLNFYDKFFLLYWTKWPKDPVSIEYIFEYMIKTNFNNKFLSIRFVIEANLHILWKIKWKFGAQLFDDIFKWFANFEWTWPNLTIIICKLNQQQIQIKSHNVMIWIRTMLNVDTHVPRTNWFYEWYIVSLSPFFISKIHIIIILFSFVLFLYGSVQIVFRCMDVCSSQFATQYNEWRIIEWENVIVWASILHLLN